MFVYRYDSGVCLVVYDSKNSLRQNFCRCTLSNVYLSTPMSKKRSVVDVYCWMMLLQVEHSMVSTLYWMKLLGDGVTPPHPYLPRVTWLICVGEIYHESCLTYMRDSSERALDRNLVHMYMNICVYICMRTYIYIYIYTYVYIYISTFTYEWLYRRCCYLKCCTQTQLSDGV